MRLTLNETALKLKSADKILVTAHVNPDGDALGSTLAMCLALRQLGKTAQIYIDDKLPTNLSFMPHIDEIKRPADGEKFDADLILVLDTSPDRIGKVRELTDAPILNVDHHVTNKNEVDDIRFDTIENILKEIEIHPEEFTPWFKILMKNKGKLMDDILNGKIEYKGFDGKIKNHIE